ncbi:MAG: RICIN domain-containing protein, partial [Clostridia bacterium]
MKKFCTKIIIFLLIISMMFIYYPKISVANQTIEDGVYEIETGVDRNKVLDVINAVTYSGGNVQIFARNNQAQCQKVNVKYVGNG